MNEDSGPDQKRLVFYPIKTSLSTVKLKWS